ncbi:hypothetical protein F8388_008468 [Cannabis sativa]|uniref:Uncharacterized protein n=1 Tax=Cannabis sativa TaxID=3483 RepID=A0A7J6EJT6_CANSA|nr:hypothetical protein F8388_008468 [Cannabis sativa]
MVEEQCLNNNLETQGVDHPEIKSESNSRCNDADKTSSVPHGIKSFTVITVVVTRSSFDDSNSIKLASDDFCDFEYQVLNIVGNTRRALSFTCFANFFCLSVSSLRYEKNEVNTIIPKAEAKILCEKVTDKACIDDDFIRILYNMTKAQLHATLNHYNNSYGNSMNKIIQLSFSQFYIIIRLIQLSFSHDTRCLKLDEFCRKEDMSSPLKIKATTDLTVHSVWVFKWLCNDPMEFYISI